MTLKIGHVPGAAGSGTEYRRGLYVNQQRKSLWVCPECGERNKGYWTRCFTEGCNAKRP